MSQKHVHTSLVLASILLAAGCGKQQPPAEGGTTAEAPMAAAQPAEPHPVPTEMAAADVDLSGIDKAEGGMTVEEIFTNKDELGETKVVVRGKVVKVNPEIMGKNWLHVRDGTGSGNTSDLTVTTSGDLPEVGDTVVVTGQVSLNKDFGLGYQYDVILEDAEVTVE